MKKIRRILIILGLLINLFCMVLPCMASSASSAYKKYVQENMIPSLGKASNGTEISSGDFGWCSKTGVFSTYIEDFNADGKEEAVVVYLKKDSASGMPFSYTDVNLAVLSIKNGKVSKIQDIAVAGIDCYLGVDFRIYVKTYSGKKYIVIQRVMSIDATGSDIFVLSMDKGGKFSGTGFCGEIADGGYCVELSRVEFSSSVSSLNHFHFDSGTSLLEEDGNLAASTKYGQLLQAGLEKYGLSLELSKISYGAEMWNLKQDSKMTLIAGIKTLSYTGGIQDSRSTVYQGRNNFQSDSSDTDKTVKISLNKTSVTLNLKESKTVKLKATVTGRKEKPSWGSSNKEAATVDSSGKVTAKKAGKAVITARIGKKTAKCTVIVKKKKDSDAELYKDFLEKPSFTVEDTGIAQTKLTVTLSAEQGTKFNCLDINNDGRKELIIKQLNGRWIFANSPVFVFTVKDEKVKYAGNIPEGSTVFAGYSKKSGLPYIYVKNYIGDNHSWEIYTMKNGKLTVSNKLSLCFSSPNKIGEVSINSKKVSLSDFKKTFKKYLDMPLPQYKGEWKAKWEGYNDMGFQPNTKSNRDKILR